MAGGAWEVIVAAAAIGGGLGVAVATAGELVATGVGAAVELVLLLVVGGVISDGALRGWLRLAGFSEVTSSLAGGCDVGGVAATVVGAATAAGLLLRAGSVATAAAAGFTVAGAATGNDAMGAAEETGEITEGVVGGGLDGATNASGMALVIILLSGTLGKATGLLSDLDTLFGGIAVPELSVELEI